MLRSDTTVGSWRRFRSFERLRWNAKPASSWVRELAKHLIIIAHLGHYHAARFTAASMRLAEFVCFQSLQNPNFENFRPRVDVISFSKAFCFQTRDAYKSAVSDGTIHSQLQRRLVELDPEVIIVSGWARPRELCGDTMGKSSEAGDCSDVGEPGERRRRSAIRETIKSRVVRLCDSALVGGHTHADYIKKLGLEPGAIFLGYDAVDNEYFRINSDIARAHPSDERMPVKLPSKYVLASARFVKKKNLETLIYGFSLARVLAEIR